MNEAVTSTGNYDRLPLESRRRNDSTTVMNHDIVIALSL